MYLLRTGCQWKALPAERFGSPGAIHECYLEWEKAGFFEAPWKEGLDNPSSTLFTSQRHN